MESKAFDAVNNLTASRGKKRSFFIMSYFITELTDVNQLLVFLVIIQLLAHLKELAGSLQHLAGY